MYPMFYPPFPPMIPDLFKLRNDYPEPPTVYSILNSYVNFGKEESEKVKITDLAKTGRAVFFDFDYPLTTHISKEDFETMILNKFLMRRIGFDTVTAFKIQLNVRLNEIMPAYNKLFDALNGWNIFNDGETITRTQSTSNTTEASNSSTETTSGTTGSTTTESGTNSNTADLRSSDTPQNQISDVRDGNYVSQYNYNQNNGTTSGSSTTSGTDSSTTSASGSNDSESTGSLSESITRTPADKMAIYREFIEARTSIYTMIFDDLNRLFYNIYN